MLGGVNPVAGLLMPGLSGGADGVPDGMPEEGNPVCGKLTALDGLLVIGTAGVGFEDAGRGAIEGI